MINIFLLYQISIRIDNCIDNYRNEITKWTELKIIEMYLSFFCFRNSNPMLRAFYYILNDFLLRRN